MSTEEHQLNDSLSNDLKQTQRGIMSGARMMKRHSDNKVQKNEKKNNRNNQSSDQLFNQFDGYDNREQNGHTQHGDNQESVYQEPVQSQPYQPQGEYGNSFSNSSQNRPLQQGNKYSPQGQNAQFESKDNNRPLNLGAENDNDQGYENSNVDSGADKNEESLSKDNSRQNAKNAANRARKIDNARTAQENAANAAKTAVVGQAANTANAAMAANAAKDGAEAAAAGGEAIAAGAAKTATDAPIPPDKKIIIFVALLLGGMLIFIIFFCIVVGNNTTMPSSVTNYSGDNYIHTFSGDHELYTGEIKKASTLEDIYMYANAAEDNKDDIDKVLEMAYDHWCNTVYTIAVEENKRREEWNRTHPAEEQLRLYDLPRTWLRIREVTKDIVYELLNYAEFIDVLNQNEDLNTLKSFDIVFNELLFENDVSLLYRLKTEDRIDDDGVYYLGGIVRKFNLKQLYEFAKVDAYGEHHSYEMFYNREFLDIMDYHFRAFAPSVDLGPDIRTPWTDSFDEELEEWVRPELASDEIWEQVQWLMSQPDISAAQKMLVRELFSKLGCAYDQSRRYAEGVYDCSSLVARCLKAIGYDLGYAPTAAEECRIFEEWGTRVPPTNLQPGDVLFFSSKNNGRYKNITHVGVYVGDGKMIDARGKDYGVVCRDAPINDAISICRPLANWGG